MEHMKLHHVGIVMNSQERADRFMKKFGLETDYMEYVESYKSNCLFTKHKEDETPIELVIPLEGAWLHIIMEKGGCITLPLKWRTWKRSKGSMKQRG